MSGKPKAVIFWPDSNEVSIEELAKINEEDRFVGATTSIKSGLKNHSAVVRLISRDADKLSSCEDAVIAEIDRVLKDKDMTEEEKKSRKGRHRKPEKPDFAYSTEIAAALGERVKATESQKQTKKDVVRSKKEAVKAKEAAKNAVDESVLNVKRLLHFNEDSADELPDGNVSSDDNVNVILSDTEVILEEDGSNSANDDPIAQSEDDIMTHKSSSLCCKHCIELRKAATKSPVLFNSAIVEFLNETDHQDDRNPLGVQPLEILPIPKKVPKCELTKGSQVFIAVHDKNTIKITCGGDPSKMTRDVLVKLYGRNALENQDITALGSKKGSKGIPENIRKAVLNFVNRNRAPSYAALKINSIINKKKHQVQRTKTPTSLKKSQGNSHPAQKRTCSLENSNKTTPSKKMTLSPVRSRHVITPFNRNFGAPAPLSAVNSTSPWKVNTSVSYQPSNQVPYHQSAGSTAVNPYSLQPQMPEYYASQDPVHPGFSGFLHPNYEVL